MKRTARKKKSNTKTLKNKLWELCKQIIRKRYPRFCYTCGRGPLKKSNWQTGHFIPKGSSPARLKYELKNLRPQCYNCNMNLGGMGAVFYRKMVRIEGQDYVDDLFRMKQETEDVDDAWYEDMIAIYEKVLKNTKQVVSSSPLDRMPF